MFIISDHSLKKQFTNTRKVYYIDNGILAHTSFRISEDYGRYLENVVFVELIRRNHEVYFHQGKKECDFIIKDGLRITQVIQVSQNLQNENTCKHEIEGLQEAMIIYGLNEGLILTEDEEFEIKNEDLNISVQPVWKWLLERDVR